MTGTSRRASLVCMAGLLVAAGAAAQRRPPTTTPAPTPPSLDTTVSTSVTAVDGMLRRMRVWLFVPPQDHGGYGLSGLGQGARVWALLPSCRPASPDDLQEPCPVDRLTLEAIGQGSVRVGEPQTLSSEPNARRVQSFVVPQEVSRVRLRLLGPQSRVRYEAVIEAARLVDLPPPEGEPRPNGFAFDLTRYPAR